MNSKIYEEIGLDFDILIILYQWRVKISKEKWANWKSIHSHPFYFIGFVGNTSLNPVPHKNIFTGMEHHHMEVLE